MSQYDESEKKKEKPQQPEITGRDIEDLRTALKAFTSNYRFRDYLADLKVITVKDGTWVVHDPVGYTRLSQINAKLELRQYYEDQEHFAAFPEAKQAHLDKISDLRKGLSDKLKV